MSESRIKPVKSLNLHVTMSEEEFERRLRMFASVIDKQNMMSSGCYEGDCVDCDESGCVCRCHYITRVLEGLEQP